MSSGSKRATLEIFESFRQTEDAKEEFQSTSDADIEAMLDQNLFREDQEEIADSALLLKQFQIASDVSVCVFSELWLAPFSD